MELYVDTQEEYWGNHDYDYELLGLGFLHEDLLYQQISQLYPFVTEEYWEELSDAILVSFVAYANYIDRCYYPFYNQTIKRFDVEVSFRYESVYELADFDKRFGDIVLVTDGLVNRDENNLNNDEVIEQLQESVESYRQLSYSHFLNSIKNFVLNRRFFDEEELGVFVSFITTRDFACYARDIKSFERMSPVMDLMVDKINDYYDLEYGDYMPNELSFYCDDLAEKDNQDFLEFLKDC